MYFVLILNVNNEKMIPNVLLWYYLNLEEHAVVQAV